MAWQKYGRIFDPATMQAGWFISHAALPVATHKQDSVYRVFFSGRDNKNRAQIGYFDYDLRTQQVLLVGNAPVLGFGLTGAFDESGVTSACITQTEGGYRLYYTGWALGVTVPFYFYVGLATASSLDGPFKRYTPAPILERNAVDPYLTASPCVLHCDGRWQMWYVSCSGWEADAGGGPPKHYYHICHAQSADGLRWDRQGHVCISYANAHEYAFARPSVLYQDGRYRMWYAYRGEAYKMGYAESADGLHWQRQDNTPEALPTSHTGWDSQMVCYGQVFRHGNQRFMLYNGNEYGKTGIGLAEWV
jgi:hypothetical protein